MELNDSTNKPLFFIQMADPQLGMFSFFSNLPDEEIEARRQRGINARKAPKKLTGFEDETRLFTKAIEAANKLKPAFVVVCGDMTNDSTDEAQLAEVIRIVNLLNEDIPLHWVAGNHDAGNIPTAQSIALYRERFGDDNYSFDHDGHHFVVINSCVCYDPINVPFEWDKLVGFLSGDLQEARDGGCKNIVLFMHHPLFLNSPDEPEGYFVIPEIRRKAVLEILKVHGVSAVFAGHIHKNNIASDGPLQMVATGPVGYPLGDDPSGLRIVRIYDDAVKHDYYALDDLPNSIEL